MTETSTYTLLDEMLIDDNVIVINVRFKGTGLDSGNYYALFLKKHEL